MKTIGNILISSLILLQFALIAQTPKVAHDRESLHQLTADGDTVISLPAVLTLLDQSKVVDERGFFSRYRSRSVAQIAEGASFQILPTEIDRSSKASVTVADERFEISAAVRFNDDALFSGEGGWFLQIPWEDSIFYVQTNDIQYVDSIDYVYFGTVYQQRDSIVEVGEVRVQVTEGLTHGYILVDSDVYRLEPLSTDATALLKLADPLNNGSGSDFCSSEFESRSSMDYVDDLEKVASSCVDRTVRVLVLWTWNANAAFNPWTAARGAIADLNKALRNSGIQKTNLSFELANVLHLPGFIEETIAKDVNRISEAKEVKTIREENEADIVVLYSQGYASDGKAVTTNPGDKTKAHVIVEIDADPQRHTFAHEVGHLLGAQHQDTDISKLEENDKVGEYALGYDYRPSIWRRYNTLLVIPSGGPFDRKRNELRFSNPDINHKGEATGTSSNNNARQLVEQASSVGCYDETSRASVSIEGPTTARAYEAVDLRANVRGCSNGLWYVWETSRNGRDYDVVGGSSRLRVNVQNSTLFVRLVIGCGAQMRRAYRTATVRTGGPGDCGRNIPCFRSPTNNGRLVVLEGRYSMGSDLDFIDKSSVGYARGSGAQVIESSQTSYESIGDDVTYIYDNLGRMVLSISRVDAKEAANQITSGSYSLPPGLYYLVTVNKSGSTRAAKLINSF